MVTQLEAERVARSLCVYCGKKTKPGQVFCNPMCTAYYLYYTDNPPLAPHPTFSPPGSKAKIKVMAWRLEQGYAIFHPDDYTGDKII